VVANEAHHLSERTTVAGRVAGSESDSVDAALERDFALPYARALVGIVVGLPDTSVDGDAARTLISALDTVAGVSHVAFAPRATLRGDAAIDVVIVGFHRGTEEAAVLAGVRQASRSAAAALRSRDPRATIEWTGDAALRSDLRVASTADLRRSELRALPLTLLLLLWSFGAVAAACLPLGLGLLTTTIALAAAAVLARFWTPEMSLQSVATVLGLALGIDYTLILVSRFRAARAAGCSSAEAAREARERAGHTVVLSGIAVTVGFAALLAVPVHELRSAAVGGMLVAVCAVLVATRLLPPLLAAAGDYVDWGRVGPLRRGAVGRAFWEGWGTFVVTRPWTVLALASLPLLLLAFQVRRLRVALPNAEWLPSSMESARALGRLEAAGGAGLVYTLQVLVTLPQGRLEGRDNWNAVRRLASDLADHPFVDRVSALPLLPRIAAISLPAATRARFVSRDGRTARIEVVPAVTAPRSGLIAMVRELRQAGGGALTGLSGTAIRIGGMPAMYADYEDTISGRAAVVVGSILAASMLVLFIGFRSIAIPLKAIALNLLTVTAALGALTLVFQDGVGGALVGVAAPLDGIFPVVPVLTFCALFGLSMDYEVFLIARVAEARARGRDEHGAIIEGLAETGGLITSAAAVMVTIFAAFAAGEILPTRMLGFALATAVFMDATLVRMALGPALLCIAGRWNWWPGAPVRASTPGPTDPVRRA